MAKLRSPACPKHLVNKTIRDEIREELELPEYVLVSKFDTWSLRTIIDDYFTLELVWENNGHNFYQEVLEALEKIKSSGHNTIASYCSKFKTYLENSNTKVTFLRIYEAISSEHRLRRSKKAIDQEMEITSNSRVIRKSREETLPDEQIPKKQKVNMIEEDPFTEEESVPDSITVVKNDKIYDILLPKNNLISPNKPYIQSTDKESLDDYFDICLTTGSSSNCSDETKAEFKELKEKQSKNLHLKGIADSFDLLGRFFNLAFNDNFTKDLFSLECNKHQFNIFLKYAFNEFFINCNRPKAYQVDDERTIFCEVFIPMLKLFGNFTHKIDYVWCEKQQKNTHAVWMLLNDYVRKGLNVKYLDGIGTLKNTTLNHILIESSGYSKTQNYEHVLEDSMKDFKNATDSLKLFLCCNKEISFSLAKKVKVYAAHVVQDKITILSFAVKSPKKWKVLECVSAQIPLCWEERKKFLKIAELFAFLYNDLAAQVKLLEEIEEEKLGITFVEPSETVGAILLDN